MAAIDIGCWARYSYIRGTKQRIGSGGKSLDKWSSSRLKILLKFPLDLPIQLLCIVILVQANDPDDLDHQVTDLHKQ